jgi:glycogen(starch) synthase
MLPGTLARDQVEVVTRSAQMMVVASRVEAFGIVILEGMRAGTPVVVTSHGEVVADDVDGLVVESEDVDALIVAPERMRDPGLRARLAAAAS